jgi:hypothetical protein
MRQLARRTQQNVASYSRSRRAKVRIRNTFLRRRPLKIERSTFNLRGVGWMAESYSAVSLPSLACRLSEAQVEPKALQRSPQRVGTPRLDPGQNLASHPQARLRESHAALALGEVWRSRERSTRMACRVAIVIGSRSALTRPPVTDSMRSASERLTFRSPRRIRLMVLWWTIRAAASWLSVQPLSQKKVSRSTTGADYADLHYLVNRESMPIDSIACICHLA